MSNVIDSVYGKLVHKNKKEGILLNNIILTKAWFLTILVLPLFEAILTYRFSSIIFFTNNPSLSFQTDLFIDILVVLKLTSVVIIAYLISFQFYRNQTNGVYGYWLALGVDRKRFFIFSSIGIAMISVLGLFFGLVMIVFFTAITIEIVDILILLLTLIVSQIFLMIMCFLVSELVELPEITFVTILIPYMFISFFSDAGVFPNLLLFPEYAFLESGWYFGTIIQLVLAVLGGYTAYQLHMTKDIELGG